MNYTEKALFYTVLCFSLVSYCENYTPKKWKHGKIESKKEKKGRGNIPANTNPRRAG